MFPRSCLLSVHTLWNAYMKEVIHDNLASTYTGITAGSSDAAGQGDLLKIC